jgi:hypothetical protein
MICERVRATLSRGASWFTDLEKQNHELLKKLKNKFAQGIVGGSSIAAFFAAVSALDLGLILNYGLGVLGTFVGLILLWAFEVIKHELTIPSLEE